MKLSVASSHSTIDITTALSHSDDDPPTHLEKLLIAAGFVVAGYAIQRLTNQPKGTPSND